MLTEQKRRYAQARIDGMRKKQAAIEAGCPEKTAAQAATRLEKDPEVQAAMGRIMRSEEIRTGNEPSADLETYIPAKANDPLEFMRGMMNDFEAEPKLRLEAAKALAAFTIAKPGEKGKKEAQEDKAKAVAKKFTGLRAVQ